MKRMFVLIASLIAILSLPRVAHADPTLTLRVEPGVAAPLTNPQAQRFNVGGAVALKPELTLGHYLGLGPSLSYMVLPSRVSGVGAGTTLGLGGFARVKRPHDELNAGTGWTAVSPWVDADFQYVRTDPLDRLGLSVAAGASVPTSATRWLWVGPFVRYSLVNQEGGRTNWNTNSAKVLVAGLSFEFGAAQKKQEKTVSEVPQEVKRPVPPVEKTEKVAEPTQLKVEFRQKIQFNLDSAVILPSETAGLDRVVQALLTETQGNIKVEGHASSEGKVEYNQKLSEKRAQAVVDYLVKHGVSRERLSAVGFGSSQPVADNKTEVGRKKNRRVEFDVVFTIVKDAKDAK